MPISAKKSESEKQDNPKFSFHLEFNTTLKPTWEKIPLTDYGFNKVYRKFISEWHGSIRAEEKAYHDFCLWQQEDPAHRDGVRFDYSKYESKRQHLITSYYSSQAQITSFCKILADEVYKEGIEIEFKGDYTSDGHRTNWSTSSYYRHTTVETYFFPVTIISKTYQSPCDVFEKDIKRVFSIIYSFCEPGISMENGIKVHIDIQREAAVKKGTARLFNFNIEDVRKIVKTSYWMEDALIEAFPSSTSIENLSVNPYQVKTRPPNMQARILRNTIAKKEAFDMGMQLISESAEESSVRMKPLWVVNRSIDRISSIEECASIFSPFAHHLMHIEPLKNNLGKVAYCLPFNHFDVKSIGFWTRIYLSYTYSSLYVTSFTNNISRALDETAFWKFISKGAEYLHFSELEDPDLALELNRKIHAIQSNDREESPRRDRLRSRGDSSIKERRRSRSRTRHNSGRVSSGDLSLQPEKGRRRESSRLAQASSRKPPGGNGKEEVLPERPQPEMRLSRSVNPTEPTPDKTSRNRHRSGHTTTSSGSQRLQPQADTVPPMSRNESRDHIQRNKPKDHSYKKQSQGTEQSSDKKKLRRIPARYFDGINDAPERP